MLIAAPVVITVNGSNAATAHYPAMGETVQIATDNPSANARSIFSTTNLIAVVKSAGGVDQLMLYESSGRPLKLWNSAPKAQHQSIESLAIHPRAPVVAIVSERNVGIWDVSQVKQLTSLSLSKEVKVARFLPDGHLLFGWRDGSVSIYALSDDFQQVSSVVKIKCHDDYLNDVVVLPENRFATASQDWNVCIWNSTTGEHIEKLWQKCRAITCLAVQPSGEQLATGYDDGLCVIYSTGSLTVNCRIRFPNGLYSCVFGAGDILYAGVQDRGVLTANTDSGTVEGVLVSGQGNQVQCTFRMLSSRNSPTFDHLCLL
jgi:WD40 repeat protein